MADEKQPKLHKRQSIGDLSQLYATRSQPTSTPIEQLGAQLKDEVLKFMSQQKAFGLSSEHLKQLTPFLWHHEYKPEDVLFCKECKSDEVHFIFRGSVALLLYDHEVVDFGPGRTIGEIGFLEDRPRQGGMVTHGGCQMIAIKRKDIFDKSFPQDVLAQLLLYMGRRVASMIKGVDVYSRMDVLIVQDGGCSPGYNSVVSYLTEYFNALRLQGQTRRVFAAAQGFKSLVSGQDTDFRYLIHDENLFRRLSMIPGVVYGPSLLHARGAAFRTERFPAFKKDENQELAVQAILARKVRTLVCVGGNGTFMGARALAKRLPKEVQVYFVPATIDSDVMGTECLGEHTAVEVGAEKLRCYMADAETHHRCYIIEMMGRDGGFHCLHSALGAGANLAVLPHSNLDLPSIARNITRRTFTVIAVAEGYGREDREKQGFKGNAAQWLLEKLRATGFLDEEKKRVVTEPFSRDIRGACPNNLDVVLAQKMAKKVVEASINGTNYVMPTVKNITTGYLEFDKIETDNNVEPELAELCDRLSIKMGIQFGNGPSLIKTD